MRGRFDSLKEIDLDMFYSVSINKSFSILQGYLTEKNRRYCEDLGFEFVLSKNGWIEADNNGVKVLLTFN